MIRASFPVVALSLVFVGCNAPDATAPAGSRSNAPELAAGGVVHRASVGSHDIVPPGVDPNFSLIAIEYSDGSVRGQWSDQFGQGQGGLHMEVDCLQVLGNLAWVGGFVKNGPLAGQRALTLVQDNGTSTNDPPDAISFTVVNPAAFGFNPDCHAMAPLPLFPLQGGEVKVE